MTNIQSGYFPTPSSTPSGQPKKIALDNPYVTKDEFITSPAASGLGLTTSSTIYTNGELDKIILRASSWVNRICRRWFDTQTIDETRTGFYVRPYNPQLVTNVLRNRPYQQINSIFIQVLKWFIQVDTSSPNSYLQDFPDLGYYKIVPLLSSAGTGMGSPIPAAILDRVALGVLWTNYTFGYGTPLTDETLTGDATFKIYTAPVGNGLWAPSQGVVVKKNTIVVPSSAYTINYPNGIVTFASANIITDVITATFVTNESIPADIKEATMLVAAHLYGQATQNPLGVTGYGIQTYNVNFGGVGNNTVKERIDQLLEPYIDKMPEII